MFKVDTTNRKLAALTETTLAEQGMKERDDLETILVNSFDEFMQRIGVKAMLLGRQIYVADEVLDHLDILAIDSAGKSVVVELKRSYDDNQLYQALGYAAMLADWSSDDFAQELSKLRTISVADARNEIEQWLKNNLGALNRSQRIVIVAEEFDFKTLTTAKWLREKHTVDVTCVQCDFSKSGDDLLFVPTVLLPTAGLAELARDTRQSSIEDKASNWDSMIESAQNREIADFFRAALDAGVEHGSRFLQFRVKGMRRFGLTLRRKHAYAWQHGRFPGDVKFWKDIAGVSAEPKNEGRSLSFTVDSKDALERIMAATKNELTQKVFNGEPD